MREENGPVVQSDVHASSVESELVNYYVVRGSSLSSNWKSLTFSGRQFTKGSHKIKSARPSEMMFRALLVLALGLASCADVDSPTKPAAPKSPEDAMRGTPTTPTRPDAAESTPCARQQPRSPCASVKHPNRRDARMRISAVIVCVR